MCPKSKYNLHFLRNRLEFRDQIFTQIFLILLAAARKARTKWTVRKLNINFTPFSRRTYAECHKLLTIPAPICLSIISIRLQSLVAVLQTVAEIFRKTSQLSTLITRTIFTPQLRVNAH